MRTNYFLLPVFAVLSLAFAGVVLADEPVSLDGRTYVVKVGERDKPLDTPHTLIFAKGRMASPECAAWGFSDGAVRAQTAKDGSSFEVVLTSEKEGRLEWRGRIEKGLIRGTSVWRKDGQKPIHYHFEGRLQ